MIIDNRLAVCWFLNSDLENDELRNQLRSMSGAGIGSVFFHWMIGGPAYMSERWLDALETTIEECSKLDMRTWLYDEAWCPSCYAGGIILAERPDLQAKTIWNEKFDAKGGERVRRRFDLMNIISIAALPIVDGSPVLKDAVDLGGQVGPVAPEIDIPYRHNYGYYPFSTPRQHWRAAKKGKMLWELDWDAPAGTDWRVYIFCQRESLRWDGVDRIDVLNPESIQMFLDVTHEKYAERFSKYFGNVIPGVMTDEFKYLPAPWSESLPELYREKYGSYLVEILPALVDKAIPESVVVKSNYHRLVSNVFAENYAAPMSRWCADRGLVLTGHISPEEDGSVEVLCAGNVATHIRHFQMPGSDIIIQAVGDRAHAELNLSPRLAASVARQEGARRVFIEAGACCEDDLSLEFFKHLFDWLMVHGINFINIHAFSYSLGGHKKFLAGQTIDTYGNLLPHFKALSDYIEEKCALFTKYRPVVKTALLKPMTAFRTTNELGGKSERGRMVDRFFTNLCLALIEEHVEFDLLDEDGADSWSVEESTLAVGEARYETVLIPRDAVVAEEAIVKLAEFAETGGVTATSNPKLEMLTKDGAVEVLSAALKKVDSDIEAAKLAAERENAWGILSKPDAKSVHMMKAENSDKDRVCFLVNISSEKPAEIAFESEGGKVPLTLKPCESRLIELPLNPELFSVDNAEAQPLAIREWKVVPIKSNHF
ncbi:MAG: hypothetical protein KAG97_04850, partial [Victivallales bacterium]|nr:hypothetical protein [Victivallales bacterium]